MKDISNNRQPSFLLMKVDDYGNKFWRLNYNLIEKIDDENKTYYECDFVPENEGLIAEEPTFELFISALKSKGLLAIEIENVRQNVQLWAESRATKNQRNVEAKQKRRYKFTD